MSRTPNGLARAAIRFRPSGFAGTFIALMAAALIVSACGILLQTGVLATVPPARYAGAPVVAAADQQSHVKATQSPVPDRARLDNALVRKAASVPGAAKAIPDLTFPVHRTAAAADRTAGPLTAHGWGSAAFTGTRLSAGAAPRTGEVVMGADAAVGDRITLDTAAGEREFTVSGLTDAAGTVWFGDAQAQSLSGHPGRVDAIVVLPRPGTTTDALADQVGHALGTQAQVRTGTDRGAVEDPTLAYAKEALTGIGGSFGGIATLVAIFTAAGTVALSVGQRRREFALLRAIGATPRQLRRTVATEALLVAPVAGALGCLPGIALASWWFGQLKEKGAIPQAVELTVSWLPLTVATGAACVTALLAGYCAARRPSKIKPGLALAESAVERLRPGLIRTPLGVAALVGGFVLAGLAASESGENAANTALGVVMLFMLAVALLGPLIARLCAGLIGFPLRAGGAAASLAAANSRTHARRLSSAITPIVLAMAFSSVLVFMHTSEDRVAAHQLRDGITADHVVSAPAGLPSGAVDRAKSTAGVSTAVSVLHTSVLVPIGSGDGAYLESASAQGVSGRGHDLARVQDLGVRTGSLDALGHGTVAVDASLAAAAHVRTGDRLHLRLPDGTPAAPRVVAVYGRGIGLPQLTLPQAELTAHVTSPFATELLVRSSTRAAAGLAGLGQVTTKDGYATAQGLDRQLNAWANTTMAVVLGGFAAVAAANTLVMTVLDRRRELSVLRLIGSTRRQVMGMIRWEALLVALAGIALGTAIALATLIPMMKGLTGEGPYIPPLVYGSFAAGVVALGLTSTLLPARAVVRR
ncbi:ABC transporter permease [Streptomyces sp. NBC_01387]|uniref:ABC transporter permease n=1 Tax=Streptomyces sp. NBC_01387 TaxID=2903849 RepID=UPI00324D5CE1